MGMKHPSPVLGEVTNCSISTSHPVERSYYQQIYLRHRKTSAEFREEVTSIAKRTAYLHYPWAQKLQATLEKASNHHLYSRYKSLLKENCTLNGKD